MSFALYMVMSEVVPAGIIMMGVREILFVKVPAGGRAMLVGKGVEGCGTGGRALADPSVTDLRVIP